jgi:hypothetical protein
MSKKRKLRRRKEKAYKILRENNWFRDYYYIVKVIESCTDNVTLTGITKTRKWGFKRLEDRYNLITKGLPLDLRNEMSYIYFKYTDQLRNIYENTFEKLAEKLIEKKPMEAIY